MAKAASFEDFLGAPSRLARQGVRSVPHSGDGASRSEGKALPPHGATRSKAPVKKEKVGLTIAPEIIDAIDDYIYSERKQGRRIKKNDVYEAALRQFLGLDEGEGR